MKSKENEILKSELHAIENTGTKLEQTFALVLATVYAVADNCIDEQRATSALFGIADMIEQATADLSRSVERLDMEFFTPDLLEA